MNEKDHHGGRTLRTTRSVSIGLSALLLLSLPAATPAAGPVEDVRRATERFKDVATAVADGYAPFLGCVSGPQEGAMGLHYVNGSLVNDGRSPHARALISPIVVWLKPAASRPSNILPRSATSAGQSARVAVTFGNTDTEGSAKHAATLSKSRVF